MKYINLLSAIIIFLAVGCSNHCKNDSKEAVHQLQPKRNIIDGYVNLEIVDKKPSIKYSGEQNKLKNDTVENLHHNLKLLMKVNNVNEIWFIPQDEMLLLNKYQLKGYIHCYYDDFVVTFDNVKQLTEHDIINKAKKYNNFGNLNFFIVNQVSKKRVSIPGIILFNTPNHGWEKLILN